MNAKCLSVDRQGKKIRLNVWKQRMIKIMEPMENG